MFDFPNGIETSLRAGLPPGVEPTFDLGKHDFESDYDDPVEENPVKNRQPVDVAAPTLPERTVKAYIIKYTSYRTFVDGSRCPRNILMDGIQLTRNNLVYLYRRYRFLPRQFSRVPLRLRQVYLSVCG